MTLLFLEAGEPATRNRVSHRAMPAPPALERCTHPARPNPSIVVERGGGALPDARRFGATTTGIGGAP
jgi:hypothetical protein